MVMINVKFSVGNKILIIGRWLTSILMLLYATAGSILFVMSFTLTENVKIIWPLFYTGLGFFISVIFTWIMRFFIYGFGLMVCNSAYQLSQKRAFTYLDYLEAKRQYRNHKIDINQFNKLTTEYYRHEAGCIEKEQ